MISLNSAWPCINGWNSAKESGVISMISLRPLNSVIMPCHSGDGNGSFQKPGHAGFAIITDTINNGRRFLFAPRLPNTGHCR